MCNHKRDAASCPLSAFELANPDTEVEDVPVELLAHFATCPECSGCEGCESGNPAACECAWLRTPHKVGHFDHDAAWTCAQAVAGIEEGARVVFRSELPEWLIASAPSLN